MIRVCCLLALLPLAGVSAPAQPAAPLPGTKPLDTDDGLSAKMLDGIHRFLERKTEESVPGRATRWQRDARSAAAYEQSVRPNRVRLRKILGIVDERLPVVMERFGSDERPTLVTEAA